MIDVHNSQSEIGISLDKAGFVNIKHPIQIILQDQTMQTIAKFDLCVGVSSQTKGVNMSRFISVINNNNSNFNWYKEDIYPILKEIEREVQGHGVSFKCSFDFMLQRESPISKQKAFMPYSAVIEANLTYKESSEIYDYKISVTAVGKTLCPCSKAISDYSAHNQRSYVTVGLRTTSQISIIEICDLIEKECSCPIYPIVKRVDEKHMTETAYDNPKFAEDVARGIAKILLADTRISYFFVSSRAEDSILPYDAYAEVEVWK